MTVRFRVAEPAIGGPVGSEIIHVASDRTDEGGRQVCSRCFYPITSPTFRYAIGDKVVVIDKDPNSSWRTMRTPSCTPARWHAMQ